MVTFYLPSVTSKHSLPQTQWSSGIQSFFLLSFLFFFLKFFFFLKRRKEVNFFLIFRAFPIVHYFFKQAYSFFSYLGKIRVLAKLLSPVTTTSNMLSSTSFQLFITLLPLFCT